MRTEATANWQSITLTTNEVWMAEGGHLSLYNFGGATPVDNEAGFPLQRGATVAFTAESTVHYRRGHGTLNLPATLVRMEA